MFSFFKRNKKSASTEKREPESSFPDDSYDSPQEIFTLFTHVTGMHFYKKEQITTEKLRNFCRRKKIGGFQELKARLQNDADLMQALIDYLTVNETFFFRELEQVDILKEIVRDTSSSFRILCAPCASGEEVYSVLIRLLEAGIPQNRFHVTGIDINASAIARAREGLYTERSVSRLDSVLRSKYFEKEGAHYRIIPSVRNLPDFRVANIFDEIFPKQGSFDAIFSRNLFIYFDEKEKKRAVEIFCSLLKPEGKMFFGHADNFSDPVCLVSEFVGRTRVYTKKNPP